MIKKSFIALGIILLLVISVLAEMHVVEVVEANPYVYEHVDFPLSPLPEVQPPTISISSPKNYTQLIINNITLNFSLSVNVPELPESFVYYLGLEDVYYTASWLPNSTHLNLTDISIPKQTSKYSNDSFIKWGNHWTLSGYTLYKKFSVNLTNIPIGEQSIEVFAVELGNRPYSRDSLVVRYGTYSLIGSSEIHFSIDNISILSPEKDTKYNTTEVPLNFRVNSNASSYPSFLYILDGNESQYIDGNVTLSGLSYGEHNVVAYATDSEGNTGVSETTFFTIANPSPTPLTTLALDFLSSEIFLTAVLGALGIALIILLVVIYKRRKKVSDGYD